MLPDDTIVAPATAPGRAAVGIIRLSGPQALVLAGRVFTPMHGPAFADRHSHTLVHGLFRDGDELVDEMLAVAMRAPHSYTGEDVVEFQCHGSPAVSARVMTVLVRAGARPAQPGEFSRRAVMNGKMDLTQAEAVAEVIAAVSDRALHAAVQQLGGALSHTAHGVRDRLLGLLAAIEAGIEFPDDVDAGDAGAEWRTKLGETEGDIASLLSTADAGRLVHDGCRVAIAGRPNAGKSSLLNRLAREERALVTDIPGTTRDTIEVDVSIAGFAVRFIDTAGMRPARGIIERSGVARARRAIRSGDLVLWLADTSRRIAQAEIARVAALARGVEVVWVWSKSDRASRVPAAVRAAVAAQWPVLEISANTGSGIAALETLLTARLEQRLPMDDGQVLLLRARHREVLERAGAALAQARTAAETEATIELAAEEVRTALAAVAELTGAVTAEDVLDRIFAGFCIGK